MRPGSVYCREAATDVDVTIYPLLFGRFRVGIGPCGEQEDGGFDEHHDFDDLESAVEFAEGVTPRQAQVIRAS